MMRDLVKSKCNLSAGDQPNRSETSNGSMSLQQFSIA